MSIAWFLYSNEIVSGPFETDEVTSKLESGSLPPDSYIWWRGQREWVQLAIWVQQLPAILEAHERPEFHHPIWYIELDGSRLGPVTQNELISHLRSLPELSRVRLWSAGLPTWSNVYELPDVMDMMGFSRRESERAPLMGLVQVSRGSDDPRSFTMKAASISQGGIGIQGAHDLHVGDEVAIAIKSEQLPGLLYVYARVQYTNSRNFVGLKFLSPQAELVSVIAGYIRQFGDQSRKAA